MSLGIVIKSPSGTVLAADSRLVRGRNRDAVLGVALALEAAGLRSQRPQQRPTRAGSRGE